MSMLSGSAISEAVADGRISIDPFDVRRCNPVSYDLTLGNKCGRYMYSSPLDSKRENEMSICEIAAHGMLLKPGMLYMMHTTERVGSTHFVPELTGKSSIGRLGICVHLTAGHGDPGFLGQWTLEVACVQPVIVYPGMRFAQMCFHTLALGTQQRLPHYAGNYVGSNAEGPIPSMSWKQFD